MANMTRNLMGSGTNKARTGWSTQDMTWDEATQTWNEATETWDTYKSGTPGFSNSGVNKTRK